MPEICILSHVKTICFDGSKKDMIDVKYHKNNKIQQGFRREFLNNINMMLAIDYNFHTLISVTLFKKFLVTFGLPIWQLMPIFHILVVRRCGLPIKEYLL